MTLRRLLLWVSSATVMAFGLAACQRSNNVKTEGASSESTFYSSETTMVSEDQSWASGSSTTQVDRTEWESSKPRSTSRRLVTVPAGTPLLVSLNSGLSTERNHSGDSFVATLSEPVVVDGRFVLPAGTLVMGTVSQVVTKDKDRMSLVLDRVEVPSGAVYNVDSNTIELVAKTSTEKDLEKVAAGGVAGGIVGGIIGGGKGALIGAAVGAGAGTVVAIATRDNRVRLEAGQKLQFYLTDSMRLPPLA